MKPVHLQNHQKPFKPFFDKPSNEISCETYRSYSSINLVSPYYSYLVFPRRKEKGETALEIVAFEHQFQWSVSSIRQWVRWARSFHLEWPIYSFHPFQITLSRWCAARLWKRAREREWGEKKKEERKKWDQLGFKNGREVVSFKTLEGTRVNPLLSRHCFMAVTTLEPKARTPLFSV